MFGFLYLWPWLERRLTGDRAYHNLLDRPRDAPLAHGDRRRRRHRGSFIVFLAGSSDRVDVAFGLSYTAQIWFYRVRVIVLPIVFGAIAYRVCHELVASERIAADRKRAEAEAKARLAS